MQFCIIWNNDSTSIWNFKEYILCFFMSIIKLYNSPLTEDESPCFSLAFLHLLLGKPVNLLLLNSWLFSQLTAQNPPKRRHALPVLRKLRLNLYLIDTHRISAMSLCPYVHWDFRTMRCPNIPMAPGPFRQWDLPMSWCPWGESFVTLDVHSCHMSLCPQDR